MKKNIRRKDRIIRFFALLFPVFSWPISAENSVEILARNLIASSYPNASVESLKVYLSEKERALLEEEINESGEYRIHKLYKITASAGKTFYGMFDTRLVRSKKMTLFLILDPSLTIQHIRLIAFFEPDKYRPLDRWLALLANKKAEENVDVAAISGATLTENSVRRSLHRAGFLVKKAVNR